MSDDRGEQSGQATVEFALVVPLIAIMMLLIVQAGLVVREQVMLINGVRQAARAAAVDPAADTTSITRSSSGIGSVVTSAVNSGTDITVTASAQVPIVVPGLSSLVRSVSIGASSTMRVEHG